MIYNHAHRLLALCVVAFFCLEQPCLAASNPTNIPTVTTVAALQALPAVQYSAGLVSVKTYDATVTTGGGLFSIDQTNVGTEGCVNFAMSTNGWYAHRILDRVPTALDCGADSSGATLSTAAILRNLALGATYDGVCVILPAVGNAIYRVAPGQVIIPATACIYGEAFGNQYPVLQSSTAGPIITVGGTGGFYQQNTGNIRNIRFRFTGAAINAAGAQCINVQNVAYLVLDNVTCVAADVGILLNDVIDFRSQNSFYDSNNIGWKLIGTSSITGYTGNRIQSSNDSFHANSAQAVQFDGTGTKSSCDVSFDNDEIDSNGSALNGLAAMSFKNVGHVGCSGVSITNTHLEANIGAYDVLFIGNNVFTTFSMHSDTFLSVSVATANVSVDNARVDVTASFIGTTTPNPNVVFGVNTSGRAYANIIQNITNSGSVILN